MMHDWSELQAKIEIENTDFEKYDSVKSSAWIAYEGSWEILEE